MDTVLTEPDLASLRQDNDRGRTRRRVPGSDDRGQEGDGQRRRRRGHGAPVRRLPDQGGHGYWTEMAGHTFLGVVPARGYDRLFIRRGK